MKFVHFVCGDLCPYVAAVLVEMEVVTTHFWRCVGMRFSLLECCPVGISRGMLEIRTFWSRLFVLAGDGGL